MAQNAGTYRSTGGPRRRPARASGSGARSAVLVAIAISLVAMFAVIASSGSSDSGTSAAVTQNGSKHTSRDAGKASQTGPSGPTAATYKVRPGDSFAAVAEKVGVSADTLQQLNPGVDPQSLQPGQKLKLR